MLTQVLVRSVVDEVAAMAADCSHVCTLVAHAARKATTAAALLKQIHATAVVVRSVSVAVFSLV